MGVWRGDESQLMSIYVAVSPLGSNQIFKKSLIIRLMDWLGSGNGVHWAQRAALWSLHVCVCVCQGVYSSVAWHTQKFITWIVQYIHHILLTQRSTENWEISEQIWSIPGGAGLGPWLQEAWGEQNNVSNTLAIILMPFKYKSYRYQKPGKA